MKKLILAMCFIGFGAVASQAQTSGLCFGKKENAAAGKAVEKMTGGFNPDKMDRVKTDGVRSSICAGAEKPAHEANHETHEHEAAEHETHEHEAAEHETHEHETHDHETMGHDHD